MGERIGIHAPVKHGFQTRASAVGERIGIEKRVLRATDHNRSLGANEAAEAIGRGPSVDGRRDAYRPPYDRRKALSGHHR